MKKIIIIGAGPVGIVLALELLKRNFSVVLVESGYQDYNKNVNKLGAFSQNNLRTHAPMELAMRRQFGGATNIWGGRCVPYDPIDFDKRDYLLNSEWPICYEELIDFFDITSMYFKCGDGIFNSKNYVTKKCLIEGVIDGDLKFSDLEKWSLPTNFRREYYKELSENKKCQIMVGKTLVDLKIQDGRVVECLLSSVEGTESVIGDDFILTNGTLEATRFLLFLQKKGLFSNTNLGKFYQGHLSGQIADVCFDVPKKNINFNVFKNWEGVYVRYRLTFLDAFLKNNELLNIAFWPVNPKIGNPAHGNGILSFSYLALISPFGKFFAPEAIRLAAVEGGSNYSLGAHLKNIIFNFIQVLFFVFIFGYQRFLAKRKVPSFYQESKCGRYPLHYHSEQTPNPDSRVGLSDENDQFGFPRLNVDFKYSEVDYHSVYRAHLLLDQKLRETGVGWLDFYPGDLLESIKSQASDGFHQVGTLRMGKDPASGVVDKNCLVYGFKNLYSVNGGVFPTSSQANTTYMAVLFGIRLANYLGKKNND